MFYVDKTLLSPEYHTVVGRYRGFELRACDFQPGWYVERMIAEEPQTAWIYLTARRAMLRSFHRRTQGVRRAQLAKERDALDAFITTIPRSARRYGFK